MEDKDKFKELLHRPQRAVLTLHQRPDGDSIGSNLALFSVLKKLGHSVDIFSKDPIPEALQFLDKNNEVKIQKPEEISWDQYEVFWALDMSSPEMMGAKIDFPQQLTVMAIDHHVTNTRWGTYNLVDTTDISVSSMLYLLLKENEIEIDKDTATALLTGLITDSGQFAYISTATPLQIASELIALGGEYQKIVFQVENQKNIEDVLFLSKALEKISIVENAVVLPIAYDIWENYGVSKDKNHLAVDYVRSIKDTDFGVVIIEETPGNFRLELRSRTPGFDVSKIAQKFGGGGHVAAAGARVQNSSIEEVIKKILEK